MACSKQIQNCGELVGDISDVGLCSCGAYLSDDVFNAFGLRETKSLSYLDIFRDLLSTHLQKFVHVIAHKSPSLVRLPLHVQLL